MSSNSTSGNSTEESTFCVTSVLDELSSYLGTNLTVNGIFRLVLGSDSEGLQALKEIPPSALCQDCVYSAAGLIEQTYPGIWDQPLVNGKFNVSGYLNGTCSNETFPVIDEESNTITLPETVYPAVENSTYPYAIDYTNGTTNGTYTPAEDVKQPPALPFADFPAAPLNGTSNSTESATSSASAASAPVTSTVENVSSVTEAASSATGIVATATNAATSAISSAVASSAPAQKRDVTAAKRRWVGQQ